MNRDDVERIGLFKKISRLVGRALVDYDMIADGERLAVAVSGGKDSVALLHVLRHRQKVAPIRFTFCAVHVDMGFEDYDPRPLLDYLHTHGFEVIVERPRGYEGKNSGDTSCFWVSRLRRKTLFLLCRRLGIRTIALGHHLDDIVETAVMNQWFRAEIAAMMPRQELFGGRIVLVRPLAYVREEALQELGRRLGLDRLPQSPCGGEETNRRARIKALLRSLEQEHHNLVHNIFRSLHRVKRDYLP